MMWHVVDGWKLRSQLEQSGKRPLDVAIAGVADFNGDGKRDILWRDSLGNVSLWLMDGLNVISGIS